MYMMYTRVHDLRVHTHITFVKVYLLRMIVCAFTMCVTYHAVV